MFLRKKWHSLQKISKNYRLPQRLNCTLCCDDEELKNYMISNKILFEELICRDKAYAEGKIHLTTRQQLSQHIKILLCFKKE
jgi:hypothetical protein